MLKRTMETVVEWSGMSESLEEEKTERKKTTQQRRKQTAQKGEIDGDDEELFMAWMKR